MCQLFKIFFAAILVINLTNCCITYAEEAPALTEIVNPAARVINIMVLSAGAALAIYIFYSAIKLALALGDPKAFLGAQNTLSHAIVGFAIIIGFYVIFRVVVGLFDGTAGAEPTSIIDAIKSPIQDLINLAGTK